MKPAYVVADSETSGLFDYTKPADADGQPRMAQLALVFLNEDLTIAREFVRLVKPDGWTMNDETAKLHGLTHARLDAEGAPIAESLDAWDAALDESHIVVGYNVSFDLKMMRAELRRAGRPDRFETTRSIDCMRPMTDVCKIKKAKGNGLKFPKLIEAYKHVADIDMEGAHDALADARACAVIFRFLVEGGLLPESQLRGVEEVR